MSSEPHLGLTMAEPTLLARWLFKPVYATSFGLLRMAIGLLTFFWSLALLYDVDPLLTWLRVGSDGDIGWWQFWPSAPPGAVVAITAGLIVAALFMTVGWYSRSAAWAVFGLTLILQRYNPAAFNGGDFIFRGVLMLGLALGPSGAYLSVDSWRKKGSVDWVAPLMDPWPLRFIQAHISLGYILTVVLKLRGHSWLGGTAVWYALGLEDLARFDVPLWIAAPPVGAVLGWSTLLIEASVGIGVWFRRSRPWVLLAGVLLHLGIATVFEIAFFQLVMLASYLAFVPSVADARDLFSRLSRRRLPEGLVAES